MSHQEIKAAIICLIGAWLYGPMGFSTRSLYDLGFNSLQIALARMFFSCLPLTIFFLVKDRSFFKIKKKDLPIFLIIAVGYLLSAITFFIAQRELSLGIATTLQMTMAFFIILFSVILALEQFTKNKMIAMGVALLGCLFATGVLDANIEVNVLGSSMAVASAVLVSVFYVGSKILFNRGYSVLTVMFYSTAIGTVLLIPFCDMPNMIECTMAFPKEAIFHCMMIGIVFTLLPIMMQMYSVKILGAGTMGVLSIFEVVSSAVAGFLFFDEVPASTELLGIMMILSSVVILNYKNIKDEISYAVKMRK